MTARDRTVLIVLGLVGAVAAFWLLALSPKRKEANDVSAQLTTAQQRLTTAQQNAADAAAARARYERDYAVVARLGKSVPVDDDVPSLVYELQTIAQRHHVDFRAIKLNNTSAAAAPAPAAAQAAAVASANGDSTAPASTTASTATAALPPGATVGPAGFPTMPFTFDFRGTYFNLQKFLRSMNGLTSVHGKSIDVNGRLLTVDGFSLAAAPDGFPKIEATVLATAYLLPADEGLTNGATPAGPAGASSSASTTSSSAPASALIGSDK